MRLSSRKVVCRARPRWLKPCGFGKSVINRSIIDGLPSVLHEGEREAIALAKEQGAQLLIEEFAPDASRVMKDSK